jgi:multicomponent Na+:H+ antiporter subunit C
MESIGSMIIAKYNYWGVIVLLLVGLYAMVVKKNLIKKIIGMNIFQTAIILFYVSVGAKKGATIPIIMHGSGDSSHLLHSVDYINPLPHVLMLTAIVVSVATLGVALALALNIYSQYGTLEEDEIRDKIREPEPG